METSHSSSVESFRPFLSKRMHEDSENSQSSDGKSQRLTSEITEYNHFLCELIDLADGNSYAAPEAELEIVLTRANVIMRRERAPATLLLFTNDLGFSKAELSALFERQELSGKGTGFETRGMFEVTSTPYLINNNYKISFKECADGYVEAKRIGYRESAERVGHSDEYLRRYYEKNVIILPLRNEKVASLMREALRKVPSATLLFLKRLTRLRIVEDGFHHQQLISSRTFQATEGFRSRVSERGRNPIVCDYFVWEKYFESSASEQGRESLKRRWIVQLVFPLDKGFTSDDALKFWRLDRDSDRSVLVNGAFLLARLANDSGPESRCTASTLASVPKVFCDALGALLRKNSGGEGGGSELDLIIPALDVYRYVPLGGSDPELGCVVAKIRDALASSDCILVEPVECSGAEPLRLCKPREARRASKTFRQILKSAREELRALEAPEQWSGGSWNLVLEELQDRHGQVLDSLEVGWVTSRDYAELLRDSPWLLRVSEALYLDLVACAYDLAGRSPDPDLESCDFLKLEDELGRVRLVSSAELKRQELCLYLPTPDPDEYRYLRNWMDQFRDHVRVRMMPRSTARELRATQRAGVNRTLIEASVGTLDTAELASRLLGLVTRKKGHTSQTVDPKLVLLVWKFYHSAAKEGWLSGEKVELLDSLCRHQECAMVHERGAVEWIATGFERELLLLLPRSGSKWSLLLGDKEAHLLVGASSKGVFVLSNDYLELCGATSQSRSFLVDAFGARDIPDIPLPEVMFSGLDELTLEQSRVLLFWMKKRWEGDAELFRPGTKSAFVSALRDTLWIPTQHHGPQAPSNCFLPNSLMASVVDSSDAPFVDQSLFDGDMESYCGVLQSLGVVSCPLSGCDIVKRRLRLLSKADARSVDFECVRRLYTFLTLYGQRHLGGSESIKVFIPAGTLSPGSQASWWNPKSCILHPWARFSSKLLPVLSAIYPETLLPYFLEVLGVPKVPTIDSYFDLWLHYREDGIEFTSVQVIWLWKVMAQYWKHYEQKSSFKARAAVLTVASDGSLELSSPASAIVPDNLEMLSIFGHAPPFLWYLESANLLRDLREMYKDLGVRSLSECVRVTPHTEVSEGSASVSSQPRFVTRGLVVAILGFITQEEFGVCSEERQRILLPLANSVEKQLSAPCKVTYSMSWGTSSEQERVEDRHLFGFWDGEGCLLRLDEGHELLLKSPRNVRIMQTQVLESICCKVLGRKLGLAPQLLDFLKGLVESRFDEDLVEYELCRKNLHVVKEDLVCLDAALDVRSESQSRGGVREKDMDSEVGSSSLNSTDSAQVRNERRRTENLSRAISDSSTEDKSSSTDQEDESSSASTDSWTLV